MKNLALFYLFSVLFLFSCAAAPTATNNSGGPGAPSYPAGIYVSTVGNDNNAGTDKAAPVLTIQVAIQKAVSNSLTAIFVAEGTYTNGFGLLTFTNSDGTTNSGMIISNHNLAFYGGCDTNTYEPQSGHFSVLNRGGKQDHVVEMKNVTNVAFNGFILTGGYAAGPDPLSPTGGGLLMTNSHDCIISNSIFTNNRGWNGGGLGLINCTGNVISAGFYTNIFGGFGGGIYLGDSANRNILSVTIDHCSAANAGGGIYFANAHSNVISGTFMSNISQDGGGINLFWGTYNILSNCVVSGNIATGTTFGGGGVLISGQRNILVDSVMTGNYTKLNGGGARISAAYCAVSNTVFSDNLATNATTDIPTGGGLYMASQNGIVYGCTFINNRVWSSSMASYGGGAHFYSEAWMIVQNSVFSNNKAMYGGAIGSLLSSSTVYLTISSNIITCNEAQMSGWGGGIYSSGGTGFIITGNSITSNLAWVGGGLYHHGWALVQNNLIASNSSTPWGSALYYANYATTNINNIILGDNVAIGLENSTITPTIFSSNIIGGSSTANTGYAFDEKSGDYVNHIMTYNLFLTNTLNYLYRDINGSNVTAGSDWTNINRSMYTGAMTADFNGVTNL